MDGLNIDMEVSDYVRLSGKIGAVEVGSCFVDVRNGWIWAVNVHEAYREREIYEKLVAVAVMVVVASGLTQAFLYVERDSFLVGLCESMGFEHAGEAGLIYGHVLMIKQFPKE